MESQAKPVVAREFRENTFVIPQIVFLDGLFTRWLFHLFSINVNFITLHSAVASICICSIYKPAICIFVNM